MKDTGVVGSRVPRRMSCCSGTFAFSLNRRIRTNHPHGNCLDFFSSVSSFSVLGGCCQSVGRTPSRALRTDAGRSSRSRSGR